MATLLVSFRIGSTFMTAPPLGGGLVPTSARLALILALSTMIAGALPIGAQTVGTLEAVGEGGQLIALLYAALREAALGAMMGLGLGLAFAAARVGASLVDVQIGFGMAQSLDPTTKAATPVVGVAMSQLAMLGFFLVDGHHAVMRGLVMSFEAAPPGVAGVDGQFLATLSYQAAQMFSLGFAMVAPIVITLMLVDLMLGVLSRNLPQMNILIVGAPIKILVGISVLALWCAYGGNVMAHAYATAFDGWEALWR